MLEDLALVDVVLRVLVPGVGRKAGGPQLARARSFVANADAVDLGQDVKVDLAGSICGDVAGQDGMLPSGVRVDPLMKVWDDFVQMQRLHGGIRDLLRLEILPRTSTSCRALRLAVRILGRPLRNERASHSVTGSRIWRASIRKLDAERILCALLVLRLLINSHI